MLGRSLLVLAAGLVAAQLLLLSALALPLDHDSLQADTLLKQESEQLSTSLEASGAAPVVREKRTIGVLRQLFPTVSQIIDRKIQAITRILFRLIGRLVLRGGGGGGGGGGGDSSDEDNERRVQITLPTFPPSEDDEEDEDEDSTGGSDDSTTTTTEPSADENAVAESKLVPVVVRKTRQAPAQQAAVEEEEYEDDDQAVAASNDNEVSQSAEAEEDADDTEPAETEDQRDKRFSGGSGGGGSGGGSGNFLFDIIRLVAGSGTTQSQDEADNAPLDENTTHPGEEKHHHDDGYSAGVPGPLTRLFVIANRGIANLIQDLILRLAQTSERIVNFKARLITSII